MSQPYPLPLVSHPTAGWLPPLPGDRLQVPGRFGTHEGIYLGPLRRFPGTVWLIHNGWTSGVSFVPWERFAKRRVVTLAERPHPAAVEGIARRALSQLGRPYKLLDYNCQDFVEQAFRGKPESYERDAALGLGLLLLL